MRVRATDVPPGDVPRLVLTASLAEVLGGLALLLAATIVVHRLFTAYVSEVQAHDETRAALRATKAGWSAPSSCGGRRDRQGW